MIKTKHPTLKVTRSTMGRIPGKVRENREYDNVYSDFSRIENLFGKP